MTDQNRLEEIKKHVKGYEKEWPNVMWLIQQAEEKVILEQKVKDLEEQFSFSEKFVDKKYQRLQEENQRYKQALEFASSELEYAHITGNIAEKDNLIKQSLKVIDEALEGETNA